MPRRTLPLAILFLSLTSTLVQAQSAGERGAYGYILAAPGGFFVDEGKGFALHVGGGMEALFLAGLGGRADVGYLFDPSGDLAGGIGMFSPGLFYLFGRDSSSAPFLTAGYSLLFRGGTGNAAFVGAGVNWWFSEGWGLQIEVRDHRLFPTGLGYLLEGRVALLID
ncbi:MAG: hypothetical protein ACRD1R_13455 [Acidobacteriota bacterium]